MSFYDVKTPEGVRIEASTRRSSQAINESVEMSSFASAPPVPPAPAGRRPSGSQPGRPASLPRRVSRSGSETVQSATEASYPGAGASYPGSRPHSPVITQPPLATAPLTFSLTKFDVLSLGVFNGTKTSHKSHARLERSVTAASGRLSTDVSTTNTYLKDSLSYDDMLRTLVDERERILTEDWRLMYTRAVFYDCEKPGGGLYSVLSEMPVISSLPAGAAILTDQRLLLLSSQNDSGFKFTSTASAFQKKATSYKLTAYTSDNINFKPLPLENFRSVELSASTGARSNANVDQSRACCWGLCCCLECVWPNAVKQWPFTVLRPVEAFHERTLQIGLLLPPWDQKVMLTFELDYSMPLSQARDFIALLQSQTKLSTPKY